MYQKFNLLSYGGKIQLSQSFQYNHRIFSWHKVYRERQIIIRGWQNKQRTEFGGLSCFCRWDSLAMGQGSFFIAKHTIDVFLFVFHALCFWPPSLSTPHHPPAPTSFWLTSQSQKMYKHNPAGKTPDQSPPSEVFWDPSHPLPMWPLLYWRLHLLCSKLRGAQLQGLLEIYFLIDLQTFI